LIAGFGVGSCIPIVTTVFSESMPTKHRGVFVTFGMAFMVLGWVIAGLVANPICNAVGPLLGDFTNQVTYVTAAGATATMYANWRLCYLIGAIPLIYGVILIFVMHETPHWYANAGRKEDAIRELARIELKTTGHMTERDPKLLFVPPKLAKSSPVVLFSNKYIVATCAIWATYFIGQFCVYGMNAWLPTWFVGIGYSQSDAVTLQTWNNVAAIASNIVVGFVSDKVGRKKNLAFSWLFCIVAIVLCSLLVVPNNFGICIALMLLFGFALNYAITAVQPLMPESYPTSIRNTGVSWCQAFARFGGSASSIVLGGIAGMALFQSNGATNWSNVVLVLIIPFILGFICTILFVKRETSGKSMDELVLEEEQ
jgi:MFS family permease